MIQIKHKLSVRPELVWMVALKFGQPPRQRGYCMCDGAALWKKVMCNPVKYLGIFRKGELGRSRWKSDLQRRFCEDSHNIFIAEDCIY